MSLHQAVIASAVRTPIGAFMGQLAPVPAPRLGAAAIAAAVERAGLAPDAVDEVFMGCVLQGGVGQAPARQAAIFAGLPHAVPCTTLNKVCGSGLRAVMAGFDLIRLGEAAVVVAGGMESMSRSPHFLAGARGGLRLGDARLVDMVVHDGLWDVYNDIHMGTAAELCAHERGISRAAQDAFAVESYARANAAAEAGRFDAEIVPVHVPQRRGAPLEVRRDEEPGRGRPEKIPSLRTAFATPAALDDAVPTITAANASSLNDGAAAVTILSEEAARAHDVTPLGRIVAYASHAQAPEWFTTAPARAIARLLDKVGLGVDDIDLFEINEAFAVVSLAVNAELGLDPEKVNVHGGAVALGHPIGASGTRILVTLLHAMQQRGARRGIASLCIGGGEAVAVLVERS